VREDVLSSLAGRAARDPQFLGQMRRDPETTLGRYGYDLTEEELEVLKKVQRQTAGMSDQELTRALAVGLRGGPITLPPGPPLPVHAGGGLLDQARQEVPHLGDKVAAHSPRLRTWP
jgi:hypothetical protein